MDPSGANKAEDRAAALGLLLEIWTNFPNVVEEKAEYSDTIIKLTQRANRDKNECLQLVSLALLFKLLDSFAAEKNPYAPIVYKTLTFALVENHQKMQIREFILNNFKYVFESYTNIPPSILIEPFIKQIRRSEGITFFYNIFDFDFFLGVAKHPKLLIKNAIQTLDLLAKIYLYDDMFASCAFSSFMLIAYRFKDDSSLVTLILKLLKFALGVYSVNVKKATRTNELKSAKYLRYINAKIEDDKSHIGLQNDRIVALLSRIVELNNEDITTKLSTLVLEENLTVKGMTKQNDEKLAEVLSKLGDPAEMIKEYESRSPDASPGARSPKKGTYKSYDSPHRKQKGMECLSKHIM